MQATLYDMPAEAMLPPVETPVNLRTQVWNILAAMYPIENLAERRHQDRFAYPRLIRLTPVADDGLTPEGDTFIVAGKHLSERGLGFYHPGPLPHRLVLADLEKPNRQFITLLMNLNWCRFISHGWYESGGYFLRMKSSLEAE